MILMHVASFFKWGTCLYCDSDACGKLFPVLWSSLATFIIGQSYLTMLCSLRWGVYIFFAGFVLVMTLYVHFFLIETKGVPLVSSHPVLGSSLGQILPLALAPPTRCLLGLLCSALIRLSWCLLTSCYWIYDVCYTYACGGLLP